MKLSLKKVAHKMGATFLLLVVFYCINTIYNQSSLNTMTDSASNIYRNHFRTLSHSMRAVRDIQQLKNAMLELASYNGGEKDTASFRSVKSNIEQIRTRVARLKEGFGERGIDKVGDKFEALDQVCGNLDGYAEKIEVFLAYNERDSIRNLYDGSFEKDFDMLSDNMSDIVNIVSGLAKTDYKTIQRKSSVIFNTSWTFFGVMVISLITFGILLTKSIKNQLGCEPYEAASITKKLASGDFSMNFGKQKEVGLYKDIKATVSVLSEVIRNVVAIANDLSYTSGQLAKGAQQISDGANDQATSAEEVSASMEEMSSSIEINSNNAIETEKISVQASMEIEKSNDVVADTVSGMKAINERIGIIEEIVSQTNILALNAAVEAARAGEHGKGFAVVASEIRKLAEHSKEAADEIISISSKSLSLADQSGEMLAELVPEIMKTAALLKQIVNSSHEQNISSNQVNNALQQLNQIIQQNAASSEEMASGSEELDKMSKKLKKEVAFFKI